jgi:NitT/TauT family transport system substrate-binding protein
MKIITQAVCALVALIAFAACAPISSDEETAATGRLTHVDLCFSSLATPNALVSFAVEQGLMEKYDLEIESHTFESGSDATVALIAGDVDMCLAAGASVVNAALAGEDLVIVAGLGNRQNYYMMVAPEIEGPADLKGKTMAVSSPGSASDAVLRSMLQSLGLQPDVDVVIMAVGGSADRLAAMESGQVAGSAMAMFEAARAESMGYHALLKPTDMDMDYQFTAAVTTRNFLTNNRNVVAGFLKGLTEASARARVDKEGMQAQMVETLGLDPVKDAAITDYVYEEYFHNYLPEKFYPTETGVQVIIDAARPENPTARDLTAADIIDASIIKDLDDSGFIDNAKESQGEP